MSNTKKIQLTCFLSILVLLAVFLPARSGLSTLYDWSQMNPNLAVLFFLVLIVFGMVLMVPVSLQAMAAGFIFGLGKGFLVMWIAGLVGFAAAFLLGRSLARPWIESWVSQRPKFVAIDKAIQQTGLMLVILTRLAMILPYNLLNYSLGLTAVRLRDYLMGSAIGMVPGIFLFVFIGTTATDIAAIVSGELKLGDYGLLIGDIGLLAVATVVVLITRVAQKALKKELEIS